MSGVKTQGTQLYMHDRQNGEIVEVGCIDSLDGISSPRDQIETTCLANQDREYEAGLRTPGAATFTINTDLQDESHIAVYDHYDRGDKTDFFVGWSDGTEAPSLESDSASVTLPETRSWIRFEAYISEYPFTFNQNDVVQSSVSAQISGRINAIPKTADTDSGSGSTSGS
ncbi:phage tail tube protein [Kushneria phosphatilytica]|uniref:Uncharacterized protein n=1 Tax=Kushneria phosphatilytica TaxID=657387 RepID=A0A1S1NS96_9GAMM|nr:phage tail tube protein [Kushneria phosphatilytica]OHV12119.1 hypothetical protein BH688_05560 [Kushneria phosphatilytica]QEL11313.1 hypothetical protein FY550_09305 [Kushneria phosphatilytica]